jgi:hypothetical protein
MLNPKKDKYGQTCAKNTCSFRRNKNGSRKDISQ